MRPVDQDGLRVLAWPGLGARRTNPYTWLLYSHLAQLGVRVREFSVLRAFRGDYDVLHAHWPEKALNASSWAGSLAGAASAIAILSAAHLHGARVVWTAHNARPHESLRPRLERWFWSAFTRRVDAVIHLSETGQRAVEAQHPVLATRRHAIVPHGHLRDVYPDTVSREEARASLRIPESARVLAFFGMVRSYKNVPHLVRTFRALPPGLGNVILLVAGAPRTPALAEDVRAAAGGDPRVRLTLEHVPEQDVQRYLRAADLVVLPFTEVTNSGSAMLALSFDRRVLVPHRGTMGELRETFGPDWVFTYEGDLTPEVLTCALEWALHRPNEAAPRIEALEWPPIARRTLSLYGG